MLGDESTDVDELRKELQFEWIVLHTEVKELKKGWDLTPIINPLLADQGPALTLVPRNKKQIERLKQQKEDFQHKARDIARERSSGSAVWTNRRCYGWWSRRWSRTTNHSGSRRGRLPRRGRSSELRGEEGQAETVQRKMHEFYCGTDCSRRMAAKNGLAAQAENERLLSERGSAAAAARSGQTGGVEAAGDPGAGVAPPAAMADGEVACRYAAAVQNFGAKEGRRKTEHVYYIRRVLVQRKVSKFYRGSRGLASSFRLCRGQDLREV
jgi:hypothetical protein